MGVSGQEHHGAQGETVPKRIGKYRIDHVIGRGAIGIVYKGYDEQIDRPLAIKTLRPEILHDVDDRTDFLRRFTTEARSAGRCVHPNIVTIFDLVEEEQAPYIVMEYVNAGTLENVIRAGTLIPIRQVGEIMAQLLLALDHAHSKGVIHRDIKPANILCPSAASIKVADFGVARLDALDVTRASSQGGLGTPNYMAPERFLQRPADARADLWSAGVILFQLLTGSRPFIAKDLPELMNKLLNEVPPPVHSLRPELWYEIDSVVQKSLARNPEDRFQTAQHFVEALNLAIAARPADNQPPLDLTKLSRPQAKAPAPAETRTLNFTLVETLSVDTVNRLSRSLAELIGPIAKMVIERALRESGDIDTLIATLTRQIAAERDVASFRQTAERILRDDLGLASAQVLETISQTEIRAAAEALMPALGPLAPIIVKKEAEIAVGRDDFYRRLAARLTDEKQKAAFLTRFNRPADRTTH
jgi:serine/threonine protein kinase